MTRLLSVFLAVLLLSFGDGFTLARAEDDVNKRKGPSPGDAASQQKEIANSYHDDNIQNISPVFKYTRKKKRLFLGQKPDQDEASETLSGGCNKVTVGSVVVESGGQAPQGVNSYMTGSLLVSETNNCLRQDKVTVKGKSVKNIRTRAVNVLSEGHWNVNLTNIGGVGGE